MANKKEKRELIPGVNCWPGCDISFDEMLNIFDKIPDYKEPTEEEKQKAREHLESLFANAKTYSNSREEEKDAK